MSTKKFQTLEDVAENDDTEIVEPRDGYASIVVKKREQPDTVKQHQFKPGQSGNPNGRPRKRSMSDIVREAGIRIAEQNAYPLLTSAEKRALRKQGITNKELTILESILHDWATSKNPLKQQLFVERIAGKVPNININAQINENLIQRFKSKLTDGELESIANGADVLEILLDKLPDVDNEDEIDATYNGENIIDIESSTTVASADNVGGSSVPLGTGGESDDSQS